LALLGVERKRSGIDWMVMWQTEMLYNELLQKYKEINDRKS